MDLLSMDLPHSVQEDADIFRFKMHQDVMDELFRFAKIHQYEDRDTFKESWATWTSDMEEMISQETDRLRSLHYRGDIIAKMFKSTKYYFCNKSMAETNPVKRKAYDEPNRELLDLMDAFVVSVYTIPPKHGFAQFCTLYAKDEGDLKLKKMFKNRHYRIVREHAK
jgi:hypothetical protein